MKRSLQKTIFGCGTVCLAILAGCDKRLDIKPVDTVDASQALRTSTDVEALLVGAYDALGDEDLYGGLILRDAELLADNGDVAWNGTYEQPREIYSKAILTNNAQVEETWNDGYEVINITNNVLANLGVVTSANRNRVEGEAKFLRGLVYFDLVRFYARPWNDVNGNPNTNPGVPLVLTPTILITESSRVARNSVAQVYAQVIADLTDAARLLPASNGFFASKGTAQAILARVYLTQEQFAGAAAMADSVIASGEYELVDNYADAFNNSSNTSEDVFAIQVTSQDGSNNMNEFFGSTENLGRGDILIEDQHLALYESTDERLAFFYEEDDLMYTGKWTFNFGNVNVVRLAEMYLVRAEANFRNGTAVGATPLEDINTIRARAGVPLLTSLTLNDILLERRRELAFEGQLLHDVKRYRQSVGSLPYNSPRLIYPIPQRELDVNSQLTQNEGY
jgi:hypothetical protein